MSDDRLKCPGPIWWGDQGIEVCETCGDCICCDDVHDHHDAERACIISEREQRCVLKRHAGRECVKQPSERTTT